MRRTATTLLATAAIGVGAIATTLPPSLASAAVPKVTVKGNLGQDSAGYRVVLLTKGGSGLVATVGETGGFAFKSVRATDVQSSTLQLVSPSGGYAGPVVLKVDKIASTNAAHQQLSGVGVNLQADLVHRDGNIEAPVIGAAVAKLVGAPGRPADAKTWYLKSAVRADAYGMPLGAAKSGLVAKPSALSASQKGKLTGAPLPLVARGAPTQAQVLGLDADADGVPNIFDVDDNGNRSLDSVDPVSASSTAATNPWTDIRREYQHGGATYNAEVPGSTVGPSDVANAIGGMGQFAAWMFIDEVGLRGSAGLPKSAIVDWARVDCGSLAYCGVNQTYEAFYGVMGEASRDSWWQQLTSGRDPVKWNAYPGHAFNCGASDADTDATIPTKVLGTPGPSNPANGLSLFCWDQGPGNPKGHIWGGMLSPQTGSATLEVFRPGDVYTVQYQVRGEGNPRSLTMVLAPFYATVPGLISVNGAAPDPGGYFNLSNDGKLTLTFVRPQRLTVAGEEGTFMDQAGLHYGLIIGPGNGTREFGCSWYDDATTTPPTKNFYSGLRNLTASPKPANPWQGTQWPLNDNGSVDEAPDANPATQKTYSFTVDVRGCIADALAKGIIQPGDISNTNPPYATLTAAGEQLTGGANRSTLLFHLSNVDAPAS